MWGRHFENFDQSQYPDLTFEVTDWRASDAYESGYVIEQSEDAGTMVKAGSTIELTISSGIEINNMQNLVNMPLENALDYLNSLSMTLDISVDYQESDVYTAGYIIRTVPERGEPLTDGQSVTLVVSTGVPVELVIKRMIFSLLERKRIVFRNSSSRGRKNVENPIFARSDKENLSLMGC